MAKYLTKAGQTVVAGLNGSLEPEFMKVNTQFGALLTVDPCTQATVTGSHYFVYASTSLANAAIKNYLVETADSEIWAHMRFDLSGSAITQCDVYEDTTWDRTTDSALLLTAYNANRNSTDSSLLTISENPTTDAGDGTLLITYKAGSATNQSRTPVGTGNECFVVLKQNSDYLVRFTSGSDNNLINMDLNWYEVQYSS